ncbi:MAG: L,D-transpeptidase family protein [Alphaproteobacteria bacterium]|nr:L,D-transpeptidase family protein [Alphaproteobacteria bacterium]
MRKSLKHFYSLGMTAILLFAQTAHAEFKQNYIGEMETYKAVYEDTLVHLARKHGLGFLEITSANPDLDPWIPGAGAEVIFPKKHLLPNVPREGIVINLPEMRVYYYKDKGKAPITYPIGIGREGLDTPTGLTEIVRKKDGPTWRPTDRMRQENPDLPASVPPGPDNPLGTHALYLGWPQYLMHGTTKPYGIGRRVSSGCMRMYPEHIIKFFEQVPVGTKVNVINEPIKLAWIGNELFIEVHPTMEQALTLEETGAMQEKLLDDNDVARIMHYAGQHKDLLNWPRIRAAVKERLGYPIRIAKHFDDAAGSQIKVEDSAKKEEDNSIDSGETAAPPVPGTKPKEKSARIDSQKTAGL